MPDIRKCSCCGRYFTPSENGVDIVSHNDGKPPASIEQSLCNDCYDRVRASISFLKYLYEERKLKDN